MQMKKAGLYCKLYLVNNNYVMWLNDMVLCLDLWLNDVVQSLQWVSPVILW